MSKLRTLTPALSHKLSRSHGPSETRWMRERSIWPTPNRPRFATATTCLSGPDFHLDANRPTMPNHTQTLGIARFPLLGANRLRPGMVEAAICGPAWFLPGQLSGHFVRIAGDDMRPERRPAVTAGQVSRHFSRQRVARAADEWRPEIPTIIPTKCRDSGVHGLAGGESHQISRHFGGIA